MIHEKEKANSAKITSPRLLALLEEQGFKCALTGWALSPDTAALDHILPLAKGGHNDISNVQILDSRVNQAKGTMTQEEFIELCCEVARNARSG